MKSLKMLISELKKQIEENYSIIIDEIEKNGDSTDGNVFIAYSNDKQYVIKLYNDIYHTKSMVDLHMHLTSSGFNVPQIVLSKEEEAYITVSDKNYLVIYSFMEGEQLNSQCCKLDSYNISQIARAVRKLHAVTNGENKFGLPELPFNNKSNVKRYSVLHFDLTKHNIFVNKSIHPPIGLIDFDDAKYGPSVCDVSIAVSILFFSTKRGVDIKGVCKFVDEYYYNETELKNKELPFIRTFALQWIDYILDNNKFDIPMKETFSMKRQLIVQNLLLQ